MKQFLQTSINATYVIKLLNPTSKSKFNFIFIHLQLLKISPTIVKKGHQCHFLDKPFVIWQEKNFIHENDVRVFLSPSL
jgi:hypothetical protein